jgi:hypothetical protein
MAGSDHPVISPPSTPQRRTASPTKRQRLHDDVFDDDEATPRAPFPMLPPPKPSTGDTSSPGKTSGNSSPTKESSGRRSKSSIRNLSSFSHAPVTIHPQNFVEPRNDAVLPEELADMVDIVSRFARGNKVVASHLRVSGPLHMHITYSAV